MGILYLGKYDVSNSFRTLQLGSHIQNSEALHRIFIWNTALFSHSHYSHLYINWTPNVLLKKLLTGLLYELQPSLCTYTVTTCTLLNVVYWRPKCVLVKHLLHVSTEFVFYLTTVISHHYSAASANTEQALLIWPTVVRSKQNSVPSCSQHAMGR